MNTGRKTSPTQPGIGSPITPGQSSGTSSRTNSSTRFAPSSGAEREAMPSTSFASSSVTAYPNSSVTVFPSSSQAFRPATSGQTPRSYVAKGKKTADFSMPVGEPLANSPLSPTVQVLLRHLPLSASEETIRVMLVWSQELIGVELLSPEESQDNGFCTAILRFQTMDGANDAKRMLDGRRFNQSMDAEMVVQIITSNGLGSLIYGGAARTGTNGYIPTTAAPGGPSGPSGREQPQPQASFQSFDSSSSPGSFPREFVPGDTMFRGFFSPSPIGNHLDQERNHVSSKSLMTGDYNDDDDTSNILKDPRAYAENNAPQGSSFGRRATAPQIPITQMASVSLSSSGPSQMPQHTRSLRRSSPTSNGNVGNAAGMSLNSAPPPPSGPPSSAHYQRHSYPPVNPADQNPPCNTLYVGNLPMETSEEELKALFSKQRGYKRLCLRTKANGPMCFVEFEDISYSTKALTELYGVYLHNSTKGGIRLSFSKNPLGVRSAAPNQAQSAQSHNGNGIVNGLANGLSTHGPPPGLSAPPGLGNGRPNLNANANGMVSNQRQQFGYPGYPAPSNNPWNTPSHPNGAVNGGSSGANASISGRAISNGYIFNNDSNNGHGLSNGYNNGPGLNSGYNNSHSINTSPGINGHSINNGHFINNGHGINNTYGTRNNHAISNGHGYSNDHISINDNNFNNGQSSNPFAPRYTSGH